MRKHLTTFIGILMILVALGLFMIKPIQNHLIQQGVQTNQIHNLTRDDIIANQEANVTYNWQDIDAINAQDVFNATRSGIADTLPTVGAIAIPDLAMNLPIYKGVSNEAMFLGATTLLEGQEMGVSNYSLSSHHSIQDGMLFEPLLRAQEGQLIYLTDLENIYTYQVSSIATVTPDRVDVTDPTQSSVVTLITCDSTLEYRIIVRGTLQEITPINQASDSQLAAFNLNQTIPNS